MFVDWRCIRIQGEVSSKKNWFKSPSLYTHNTVVFLVTVPSRFFYCSSVFVRRQIIFHFLWDHWAHCGIFENGILLMYTLEGVSSVANFITAYEESQ